MSWRVQISMWLVEYILNQSTANFGRILKSIKISLVGLAPGLYSALWISNDGSLGVPATWLLLVLSQKKKFSINLAENMELCLQRSVTYEFLEYQQRKQFTRNVIYHFGFHI